PKQKRTTKEQLTRIQAIDLGLTGRKKEKQKGQTNRKGRRNPGNKQEDIQVPSKAPTLARNNHERIPRQHYGGSHHQGNSTVQRDLYPPTIIRENKRNRQPRS
ncbi:unnamed protein product, partial [Ectocarpus sp. 4 AP-2014]